MRKYSFDKYSQQEIIQGIRDNDTRIIRAFYQSQYPKIEQYVVTNRGSFEDAKDVYQEAFVAIWHRIRTNSFLPESQTALAGFLYQIAKNKWLDKLRASSKTEFKELSENIGEVVDEAFGADREADHRWVLEEFQKMDNPCKEVLRRFYFQKETMEQIAQAFAWTTATARNNKYRCLQKLRDKWKFKRNHSIE